eukprot:jgi/Hompol1/2231/HPOL_002869-RA
MLERAQRVGVERMIITGLDLPESTAAVALAQEHGLQATVGCHPTHTSAIDAHPGGADAYFAALADLVRTANASSESSRDTETDTDISRDNPTNSASRQDQTTEASASSTARPTKISRTVVAIGECGLDYDRLQFASKEHQNKHFHRHFELAKASRLPMFLHDRNTGTDFVDTVRRHRSDFSTGVVHSFTGTLDEMQIPLDKIMLETDAPWCDVRQTHASFAHLAYKNLPDPLAAAGIKAFKPERFSLGHMVKSRNEPCAVRHVLRVVAALHEMDEADLADIAYSNTMRVFYPDEQIQ